MGDFKLSESTKAHLDIVCALAERNGWNAAINACRQFLPPSQSIRLCQLYKLEEPSLPPAGREAGSTEDVGGKR
jgi:hypothetical protein